MNKKGFMYSAIVLLFVLFFTVSFISSKEENAYLKSKTIRDIDSKIDRIEEDLERGVYIVGFRSLMSIEQEIRNRTGYVENTEESFRAYFFEGGSKMMENSTFSNFTESLESSMRKENLIVEVDPVKLSIRQEDPWHIKPILKAELFVTDITGIAEWNITMNISREISISELNDPLYYVETGGLVQNPVEKTPYEDFIKENDFSNLSDHLNNSYYKASATAPDYIMRMEGNNTPSEEGIESLVNIEELSEQGLAPLNKSSVDHIYFSSEDPNSSEIENMQEWFRLDDGHLEDYNATGHTE
ncbi:MAG: hypothetical protein ACQEP1_05280 [Nanobdellota archaeon]